FLFHHLARLVVQLPHDEGAHSVDHLGEVGDDEYQAMRNGLFFLLRYPLIDVLRPRLQWEPFVVDAGRMIEIVAIELLELFPNTLSLLRQDRAAGRPEARAGKRESDQKRDAATA